jgi:hypothetical protein
VGEGDLQNEGREAKEGRERKSRVKELGRRRFSLGNYLEPI